MGPEDLMGGDAYGMWQYGGGDSATRQEPPLPPGHRGRPRRRQRDLAGFAIHGYGSGRRSSAAGAVLAAPGIEWVERVVRPARRPGIPANVGGFSSYGKTSWMTETSGEKRGVAGSSSTGGFPTRGRRTHRSVRALERAPHATERSREPARAIVQSVNVIDERSAPGKRIESVLRSK